MSEASPPVTRDTTAAVRRRILVVDDNRAIHDDFRKILTSQAPTTSAVDESEAALFGEPVQTRGHPRFDVDFASQGMEGAEMVARACAQHDPYALAFVDMRMPPGWDGMETTQQIWERDPNVQVVICTAYSDHSWEDILAKLGHTDRLLILKKPFDNIEVLQLAGALTQRWHAMEMARQRIRELELLLERRASGAAA